MRQDLGGESRGGEGREKDEVGNEERFHHLVNHSEKRFLRRELEGLWDGHNPSVISQTVSLLGVSSELCFFQLLGLP